MTRRDYVRLHSQLVAPPVFGFKAAESKSHNLPLITLPCQSLNHFFSSGQFGTSWSCSCGHAFLSMISSLQPQEFSVSGCRILLPQDLRHVSQQFPIFKQSTETTVTRFGGNILSLYVYVLYFIYILYY